MNLVTYTRFGMRACLAMFILFHSCTSFAMQPRLCPGDATERMNAMQEHLKYVMTYQKNHNHIPHPGEKQYAVLYSGYPELIKQIDVYIDNDGKAINYSCATFKDKDKTTLSLLSCSIDFATKKIICD